MPAGTRTALVWGATFAVMLIVCLPGLWVVLSAFRPNGEILTKPAIWSAAGSRSPAYNCTGVQSNPNAPNSSAMRAGPSNATCPTMATGCAHFMVASIRRRAQSVKVSHYM